MDPRRPDAPDDATGRLLAVAALIIAGLGVVYALAVVPGVNVPVLPAVAVPRLGLLLVLAGLVALVLGFAGTRRGGRPLGSIAAVLAAAILVIGLVPVAALAVTGAGHGAVVNPLPALVAASNSGQPVPERSRTYATVEGRPLELDVWSATTGSGPRPAIVWMHGGGWIGGNRGSTPRWNEWFNERGWSVFDIDYRTGPPPRWQQAPADVHCAVAWVKANAAELNVDPNMVVLAGESAGAHLALLAAYTSPTVFPSSCAGPGTDAVTHGVVAISPITDVARFWTDDTRNGLARLCVTGFVGGDPTVPGSPEATAAATASPTTHVRQGHPPTLLVHGEADDLVSVAHTRELDRRLAEQGVTHETVLLPFTDHAFDHDFAALPTQITRTAVGDWLRDRAPEG